MPNYTECANLLVQGVVAKADPDIAGLGVIFAFTISAGLTLLAIGAAYFTGLVDAGLLGPVDRIIMHIPARAPQHPRIHVTLRKAIMACSDQQIVTGIAILAAGFHGLVTGHISVYHFHIVLYLAWMSSSVHLSALTLLKPFMQQHRGVLVWRSVGMLVLLVMMIIALVPTISNDWAVISLQNVDSNHLPQNTVFGVPAICFWGQLYDDGVNPDAILSYIVLFVSYLWKMGGLFPPITSFWTRYVRNPWDFCLEWPLSFAARKYGEQRGLMYMVPFWIWLAIYVETTAVLEVLDSFSAALWLSTLGFVYGILQIAVPRGLVQTAVPDLLAGESEWSLVSWYH
ncbi:hypothetical protein AMS68_007199 [Peltaster fructicola]|uniref:Uncharacterized protein n=1 Tax=Peltaster fructicola TaxID=286661 RepID=A0A6H0Y3T2_9PEZI|nr:hypothetical protein AMS68_007199 [Peltaster fructicola]